MKVIAIIPSGGHGARIGDSLPKQYHLIAGKELISYTIDVFQKCDLINEIIIPAQKDYFNLLKQIKKQYQFLKISKIIEGGSQRQDSVYNALLASGAAAGDFIVVHDAARPLLSLNLLEKALNTAKTFDNVLVALSARDTLVRSNESNFSYIDRKDVFYAQTPQVFRYEILMDAFIKAKEQNFYGTDESMLVTKAGYQVKIIEGSLLNFKITTREDLDLFTNLIKIL